MTQFSDEYLQQQLKELFGFNNFIRLQKDVIQSLLSGNDTLLLCLQVAANQCATNYPALLLDGTAIVISPLIALMKNQVDSIRSFGSDSGIAHFLNSSLTKAEITKVKEDVINKKTKLLFVAPESLTKEDNVLF